MCFEMIYLESRWPCRPSKSKGYLNIRSQLNTRFQLNMLSGKRQGFQLSIILGKRSLNINELFLDLCAVYLPCHQVSLRFLPHCLAKHEIPLVRTPSSFFSTVQSHWQSAAKHTLKSPAASQSLGLLRVFRLETDFYA